MGKTALLDAAVGMARERRIRVFRGTCDVAAQVIPLGALLGALVSAPDAPVDPAGGVPDPALLKVLAGVRDTRSCCSSCAAACARRNWCRSLLSGRTRRAHLHHPGRDSSPR